MTLNQGKFDRSFWSCFSPDLNWSFAFQDALELKAKDAAAAAAKKEKDKQDRLNQKNKGEERKKKAQEKAAKGERKTGRWIALPELW